MPSSNPDASRKHPKPRSATPAAVEVVDPIWLAKALALSLAAALLCAYAAVCLLFYQGAWQLVLHPTQTIDRTPASAGLPFSSIRFGDYNTGQPHLTAWWVPAQSATAGPVSQARYSSPTVLYLHGGSGSLSDTIPAIALLHRAGLNIFAIDYRGFGASDASLHPDAPRMAQDAAAALDYLVATRHIPARRIIPYGTGLGAPLAVQLAQDHTELPAIILDNPDPDPAATAAAARPSRIIPVRRLFGDRFAIAKPLASLATPKLLIAGGTYTDRSTSSDPRRVQELFQQAASPSYSITLPSVNPDAAYEDALRRFLDQYVTVR
jgi:hypothetical protein